MTHLGRPITSDASLALRGELASKDTSFSGCFGAIECAVGAYHHVFQRFVALAKDDPGTERQGYGRRDNSLCGYRCLYARQCPLGEKAISAWHDQHKFFATPTTAKIGRAQCFRDNPRQVNERGVAHCMPMSVIDVFEIIQVNESQGERLAGPSRSRHFASKRIVHSSAI